jgi:prepilin-type N-terminal cleavage/methylation domain-containing protein
MKKSGFTLIELLTVIAIIIILCGIGMAVYPRAKESANKNADMSKMNEIRNAVQLYREDQGAYPPHILGYATVYTDNSVMPADQVVGYLVPRRLDLGVTQSASSKHEGFKGISTATWPNALATPSGAHPIYDMDGDGVITASDDPGNARQAWSFMDGCITRNPAVIDEFCGSNSVSFYTMSGFDVAKTRYIHPKADPVNPCFDNKPYPTYELRYALFWSKLGLEANIVSGQGQTDDEHQLGYNNPSDNTIITWSSDYRRYESGSEVNCMTTKTAAGSLDTVLTVGGNSRNVPGRKMLLNGFRGYY